MSNITLTAGIRQNLLSLQGTAANLQTTQEALSTGKKVNSAADNPSAYFTSQNLTNSANSLSALLDQIGQGQQTINAATDGLTGLSSLLEQALSTAQQAQQASPTTAGATTGSVDISSTAVPTASAGNLLLTVGLLDLHRLDYGRRGLEFDRKRHQRHDRPRQHRRPHCQRRRQRPPHPVSELCDDRL